MSIPAKKEGTFSWFELMTSDVEAAKTFYGALLGWQFTTDNSGPMTYTNVALKGSKKPIAGIFDRSLAMVDNPEAIPPHWGCYITVENIDEKVERVVALGGTIIVEPKEIPRIGRFSVIMDPQGAVVSLFEHYRH